MRKVLGATVVLGAIIAVTWVGIRTAEGKPKPRLRDRMPSEVIDDLLAARAAGDWDAVASNYAVDAFVIDDQGILVGPAEIAAAEQSFDNLFQGAQAEVSDAIIHENIVRILYSVDGGWIVIPDGMDTYVIERGLIRQRIWHGRIEFTGPPPEEDE